MGQVQYLGRLQVPVVARVDNSTTGLPLTIHFRLVLLVVLVVAVVEVILTRVTTLVLAVLATRHLLLLRRETQVVLDEMSMMPLVSTPNTVVLVAVEVLVRWVQPPLT